MALSEQGLEQFSKGMLLLFQQKESEDNWVKFEESILELKRITETSWQLPTFISVVKRLRSCIIVCLVTDRTRLARTGLSLVSSLAVCLKSQFEELIDLLPTVLKLTTRANKYQTILICRVYVTSATLTLRVCIEQAGLVHLLPTLVESLKTPSKTHRLATMECIVLISNTNSRTALHPHLNLLEQSITLAIVDPMPEVRDLAKLLFEKYREDYSGEVDRFTDSLPDMARKYLKVESKGRYSRPVAPAARKVVAPAMIKKAVKVVERDVGRDAMRVEQSSVNDSVRSLGGAQRVARVVAVESKIRMKPAMRVVSTVSLSTNSTASLEDKRASKIEEKKAVRVKSIVKVKAIERAVSVTLLGQELESNDWSKRQQAFESLKGFSGDREKTFKLMMSGVVDAHYKVTLSCLECLLLFISTGSVIQSQLEMILPRVSMIAFNPLKKTKVIVSDKCNEIFISLLESTSKPLIGLSVATCLGLAGLSSKMRVGVLGFIASLSPLELKETFSAPKTLRNIIMRIVPFLIETDVAILAALKQVFESLWEIYPNSLCTSLSGMTMAERVKFTGLTSIDLDLKTVPNPTFKKAPRTPSQLPIPTLSTSTFSATPSKPMSSSNTTLEVTADATATTILESTTTECITTECITTECITPECTTQVSTQVSDKVGAKECTKGATQEVLKIDADVRTAVCLVEEAAEKVVKHVIEEITKVTSVAKETGVIQETIKTHEIDIIEHATIETLDDIEDDKVVIEGLEEAIKESDFIAILSLLTNTASSLGVHSGTRLLTLLFNQSNTEVTTNIKLIISAFERLTDSSIILEIVFEVIDINLKSGLEMLLRAISINTDLRYDQQLSDQILNGLEATQPSAIRKVATDLSFKLLTLRDADWADGLYSQIGLRVGANRERIIRNMVDKYSRGVQ